MIVIDLGATYVVWHRTPSVRYLVCIRESEVKVAEGPSMNG